MWFQFAQRGHRTGKIALHKCCWGGTWYVEMDEGDMKSKLGLYIRLEVSTLIVPIKVLRAWLNLLYKVNDTFVNWPGHNDKPNVSIWKKSTTQFLRKYFFYVKMLIFHINLF